VPRSLSSRNLGAISPRRLPIASLTRRVSLSLSLSLSLEKKKKKKRKEKPPRVIFPAGDILDIPAIDTDLRLRRARDGLRLCNIIVIVARRRAGRRASIARISRSDPPLPSPSPSPPRVLSCIKFEKGHQGGMNYSGFGRVEFPASRPTSSRIIRESR